MRYVTLGHTGLTVSRLCFGAMTFGQNAGIPALNKVDAQTAQQMVDEALAAGVNFFDTADSYAGGQSETMLGAALAARRHEVVIATKVGFRTGPGLIQTGLTRQHIIAACEASLRRLGTDYIDLYHLHKEDPYTPLDETLRALDDLVRAGKVRYLGFSNWPAWKAAMALQMQRSAGWARFECGQVHYSLLNREVEYDIAPFMIDSGLNMNIWSPLAGGFLSGKYTRQNLEGPDKDAGNRHAAFDIVPFDHDHGFQLVDRMREIAARRSITVADVAMAWLLSRPGVGSLLLGASKPSQLTANLAAVDAQLDADDIALLDQFTAPKPIYPYAYNARVLDRVQRDALNGGTV